MQQLNNVLKKKLKLYRERNKEQRKGLYLQHHFIEHIMIVHSRERNLVSEILQKFAQRSSVAGEAHIINEKKKHNYKTDSIKT